jgi:hypothetical protein
VTRDEFIADFMLRHGIDPSHRVSDGIMSGYQIPCGPRYHAAPCDCGNDYCHGFAMIAEGKLYPDAI